MPPSEIGTPLVVDIRRNALDDGPGIRSVVFFKGCVLHCVWCQNPETLSVRPELQRRGGSCIGCQSCARVCPHGAVSFAGLLRQHDPRACQLCGACVEVCPPAALRVAGQPLSEEELVAQLLLDEPFYRSSGGGVTFSGGEPTLHLSFLAGVASRLGQRGVHLLLQTCGLYRAERFERDLLPLLDTIFFDLKLADPSAHRRFTGQDNRTILDNLARLAGLVKRRPDRLLCRVPLVPGITDSEENLLAIARILLDLGLGHVALLAYNPLWIPKRKELARDLPYCHEQFMSDADLARCRELMAAQGLQVA